LDARSVGSKASKISFVGSNAFYPSGNDCDLVVGEQL
jgi:hypothetical protein